MSALNGDLAQFHKDRKRTRHRRQRLRALTATLRKRTEGQASQGTASRGMQDEGGALRIGD